MTAYENLLVFYARLQEKYGWTVGDVDDADMGMILDQLAAVARVDAPAAGAVSIEDVT